MDCQLESHSFHVWQENHQLEQTRLKALNLVYLSQKDISSWTAIVRLKIDQHRVKCMDPETKARNESRNICQAEHLSELDMIK